MTIVTREQIAPYITADGSTIRELLNGANAPLHNQSLAEATLAPGQKTARHFHPRAEEIYYILSGRGMMIIGEETRAIASGAAIAIAAGAPHHIENDGAQELRFLCCCAPAYSHQDTILCV